MSQFVTKKLQEAMNGTPQGASELKGVVIPPEVLDLVRFLAKTWSEVDHFVYENCNHESLVKYPVVQGTRNQIDLHQIGQQPHDPKRIRKAVDWLLSV